MYADDVREAEALLRGEPIEAVAERERERQEKLAEQHARLALQDRYGRTLAVVLADGRDVAEVLIGEGLAREYHDGRRDGWCE